MSDDRICAVVVSFHPQEELLENITQVISQVQALVLIDNGSSDVELRKFRMAAVSTGFTLIENGQNLGVAAGLNVGVQWAVANGYSWVLLFDQDSTVTENFVASLLAAYESHPSPLQVAVVSPRYISQTTGLEMGAPAKAKDGGVMVAMTSGSLMPLRIFREAGWFNEGLFIDEVDFEFCLRVRKLGFTILQARDARLIHRLGKQRRESGSRFFTASHHSAKRRYYITRNRTWVVRSFIRSCPLWCLHTAAAIVKDTVKIVLGERDRWAKLKSTARGLRDGLQGRLGKTVDI